MEKLKTLEEMPGALSYLIEKVEGLEKTAQSLLNRQEECCSPHWMDVDELCDYIPSHPVKQTVYGWVSDRQIPHHKINKAPPLELKRDDDIGNRGTIKLPNTGF